MPRHRRPWSGAAIFIGFLVVIALVVVALLATDSPLLK
jgi:hypothetical protein